ncbi:MAG: patatin-like phospholipase family protein [Candidatus Binatia bacterium]
MLGVMPRGVAPFDVIVGSSAGSINAGMSAAHADDLASGVDRLIEVWSTLSAQDVFRTDLRLPGQHWRALGLGLVVRRRAATRAAEVAPRHGAAPHVAGTHPAGSGRHARAHWSLYAVAVAATDLHTSNGFLFVRGHPGIRPWKRSRWRIERSSLRWIT